LLQWIKHGLLGVSGHPGVIFAVPEHEKRLDSVLEVIQKEYQNPPNMVDKEIVKEIPQRKKTGVLPATVNLI
jgi:hypothetical protein